MTDRSGVGVGGAVVSQRTSSQLKLGFSGKASWSCFSLGLKGDAFPSASFSRPIPHPLDFSAQLLFASRSLGQRPSEVTSQGHTAGRWQKQDLKTESQGTGVGASSWRPRAVCTS